MVIQFQALELKKKNLKIESSKKLKNRFFQLSIWHKKLLLSNEGINESNRILHRFCLQNASISLIRIRILSKIKLKIQVLLRKILKYNDKHFQGFYHFSTKLNFHLISFNIQPQLKSELVLPEEVTGFEMRIYVREISKFINFS